MDLPVDSVRIYRTKELRSFDTDQLLSVLSDSALARGRLLASTGVSDRCRRTSMLLRRQIARVRTIFSERALAGDSSHLSDCELTKLNESLPILRTLESENLQSVPRSIRLLWSFVYGTLIFRGLLPRGLNSGTSHRVDGLDQVALCRALQHSSDINRYRHSLANISPFDPITYVTHGFQTKYVFKKDESLAIQQDASREINRRVRTDLYQSYDYTARKQVKEEPSESDFEQRFYDSLADLGLVKRKDGSLASRRHLTKCRVRDDVTCAEIEFRDNQFGLCRRGAWSSATWLMLDLPGDFLDINIEGLSSVQLVSSELTVPPRLASFVCNSGKVSICARVTKVSSHSKADLLLRIFLSNGDWAQHNFHFV